MKTITLEKTTLFDAVYNYLEENFDYMEITKERIDEFYNVVEIGTCKFNPSEIMKELAPNTLDEWIDEEIEFDAEEILYSLEEEGEVNFFGGNIKLADNVLEIESVVKC